MADECEIENGNEFDENEAQTKRRKIEWNRYQFVIEFDILFFYVFVFFSKMMELEMGIMIETFTFGMLNGVWSIKDDDGD